MSKKLRLVVIAFGAIMLLISMLTAIDTITAVVAGLGFVCVSACFVLVLFTNAKAFEDEE